MNEKEFLTAKETANYLGMALSYLYKLTASKSIPFYAPTGKRLLFKKAELNEWIESHRVAPMSELTSKAQSNLVGASA